MIRYEVTDDFAACAGYTFVEIEAASMQEAAECYVDKGDWSEWREYEYLEVWVRPADSDVDAELFSVALP